MKISQFNPHTEVAKFCAILHPVTGDPLVDEDGTQLGFDVLSANSKTANKHRRVMSEAILRHRTSLLAEMGHPTEPDGGDAEAIKAYTTAKDEWEKVNKDTFSEEIRSQSRLETLNYLSSCCSKMYGNIELDNGQAAETPLQVFMDQEWVANLVFGFHNQLANWIPKQQGS